MNLVKLKNKTIFMEKELYKYIKDGLSINKREDCYDVWTIPTQHFKVLTLDELTPERFEEAVQKHEEYLRSEKELWKEHCLTSRVLEAANIIAKNNFRISKANYIHLSKERITEFAKELAVNNKQAIVILKEYFKEDK